MPHLLTFSLPLQHNSVNTTHRLQQITTTTIAEAVTAIMPIEVEVAITKDKEIPTTVVIGTMEIQRGDGPNNHSAPLLNDPIINGPTCPLGSLHNGPTKTTINHVTQWVLHNRLHRCLRTTLTQLKAFSVMHLKQLTLLISHPLSLLQPPHTSSQPHLTMHSTP